MAQAEFHEVMDCDRDRLYQVITNYAEYPQFVEGCKKIDVERTGPQSAKVSYLVSMMKEVKYTIDLKEDPAQGVIHWSLLESDSFKVNNGRWELKSAGPGKTDVRYSLELEFKFPVPGLILNKLVKGSLPLMVASFVKRSKK